MNVVITCAIKMLTVWYRLREHKPADAVKAFMGMEYHANLVKSFPVPCLRECNVLVTKPVSSMLTVFITMTVITAVFVYHLQLLKMELALKDQKLSHRHMFLVTLETIAIGMLYVEE